MISKSSLQKLLALLQSQPPQAADRMLISEADYYGFNVHAPLDEPVFLETCLVFPTAQWSSYGLRAVVDKLGFGNRDVTCRDFQRGDEVETICNFDVATAVDYLKWALPQLRSNAVLYALLGTAGVAAAAGIVWSTSRSR